MPNRCVPGRHLRRGESTAGCKPGSLLSEGVFDVAALEFSWTSAISGARERAASATRAIKVLDGDCRISAQPAGTG